MRHLSLENKQTVWSQPGRVTGPGHLARHVVPGKCGRGNDPRCRPGSSEQCRPQCPGTRAHRAIRDYVAYYMRSRTHLALGKDTPSPRPVDDLHTAGRSARLLNTSVLRRTTTDVRDSGEPRRAHGADSHAGGDYGWVPGAFQAVVSAVEPELPQMTPSLLSAPIASLPQMTPLDHV